jgi:hypothetical protein
MPIKIKTIFISITLLSPFWYFLYPSYYQFQTLCSQNDRLQILQTAKTDVISMCGVNNGLLTLQAEKYKAFYCDGVGWQRGEGWTSTQCQDECLSKSIPYSRQSTCIKACLEYIVVSPDSLPFYTNDYQSDREEIISNRLIAWKRTLINEQFGVMAKSTNYIYYPYGNGLAKILGMASGTAPSLECKKESKINKIEIFPPK